MSLPEILALHIRAMADTQLLQAGRTKNGDGTWFDKRWMAWEWGEGRGNKRKRKRKMHSRRDNLLDANDTAAPTVPGVPGCRGKSMVALAKIIFAGVYDYGPSQNVVRSAEGDDVVGDVYWRLSLGIRADISQIADVSDGVLRRAMSHLTKLLVYSSLLVMPNVFRVSVKYSEHFKRIFEQRNFWEPSERFGLLQPNDTRFAHYRVTSIDPPCRNVTIIAIDYDVTVGSNEEI